LFPRLEVNKTILKARLAAATGRVLTHMWDFPDVIKNSALQRIRCRRKQSSSSIRTITRIGLKS